MTYEVDTDSRNIRLGIGIIGKSEEETGLPDSRVSDEEKLEEVVVPRE